MSLETDIELISQVPLFAELSGDQMRLLAFSASRRELEPGAILFMLGEIATSGFVVLEGTIELATGKGEAREVIETCGAGYLIGELPLFISTRRRMTATATQTATVLEVSRELMSRMLSEYPQLASMMRAHLSRRVGATLGDLQRVRDMLLAIGPGR